MGKCELFLVAECFCHFIPSSLQESVGSIGVAVKATLSRDADGG